MHTPKRIQRALTQYEADHTTGPHFELFGDRRFLADGCYGIIDYNSEEVRINLKKGQLLVVGNRLELQEMESQNLIITGHIHSVEFVGGVYESGR